MSTDQIAVRTAKRLASIRRKIAFLRFMILVAAAGVLAGFAMMFGGL